MVAAAGMAGTGAGPDMSKYKMPMILGILGGVLALVGTILPWISACTTASSLLPQMCLGFSGLGISGLAAAAPGAAIESPILAFGGILILLFGIIGLVMMLLKKPQMAMIGMVMGILALLIGVLWYVQASPLFNLSVPGVVTVSAGMGLWLSIIGGLLLFVGGFMGWNALKAKPGAPAAPGA